MSGRQDLAIFTLSLLLHGMLVLLLGGVLTRPERIVPRIEIGLEQTVSAPKPSAPEPLPAKPIAPKPKPKPVVRPVPKPVVKPIERTVPKPVPAAPAVTAEKEPEEPVTTTVAAVEPGTPEGEPDSDRQVEEESSAVLNQTGNVLESTGTGQGLDDSALQRYLAAVRARIEAAKRYPKLAEQRRTQGVAVVAFRLDANGRLLGKPEIANSSGSSLLDGAALRAVRKAAPYPRFPGPAGGAPEPLTVELNFVIR